MQLEEGEKRLEVGLHYGIAYPRLFHADQFEKVRLGVRHTQTLVLHAAGCNGTAASTTVAAFFVSTAPRTALAVQVPYVHRPMESAVEEVAGSIKDKGTAARLAAAARRRKERLAQQQQQQQGQQQGQQAQGPGEG